MLTIYHNPHCSKSREGLTLVQEFSAEHGVPLQVVEYLKTPLTLEQLSALQRQLGVPVHDMVRDTQPDYERLQLEQADSATLLQALAECPALLQRPIVTYRGRALIGRPPALLSAWLQAS